MRRLRPRGAARGGFTLVEVMVSVTLLAVLMLILWGSFINVYNIQDASTARFESIRAAQAALRRMQREISMAFVSKIGEIPTNENQEVTYQTAFIGTRDRLDFTAFAHMRTRAGEIASEQAEVSYYLARVQGRRDGRLHQNLVRREQAPIDGDMQRGGYLYTLLQDVESLTFEYWNSEREIAGDAWERSWDSTDPGVVGLPPRVRITLEILDPICQIIRNDPDRRRCELRRPPLRFTAQADIPLRLPIGFATHNLSEEAMRAEAEARQQQLRDVLDPSSDDFDSDEFDNPGQNRTQRGNNRPRGNR
jgi:general secretion pathway protein J